MMTRCRRSLQGDFARWQVFLHPLQRKIVERSYNGPPGSAAARAPARRSSPCTASSPPGRPAARRQGKDVLFTTFNKNLAADLRHRLLELAGRELLDRVEVVNIDRLASKVVTEAEPGTRRHWMDDSKAIEPVEAMLLELGEHRLGRPLPARRVVPGRARAGPQLPGGVLPCPPRRAAAGTLNRMQRAEVWQLVEQFTKRLTSEPVDVPPGGRRTPHGIEQDTRSRGDPATSTSSWMRPRT